MTHELKTHPAPFVAVLYGRKRFEFRRDDRDPPFALDDLLLLREWYPDGQRGPFFTGRAITVRVTYLLRGPEYGIPEGYVCMSILKSDER